MVRFGKRGKKKKPLGYDGFASGARVIFMEVGCGRGSFDYYICQEVFRQVNVLHVVGKFKMWAPQCQEKKETGQATTSEIVLEKCGKKKKRSGSLVRTFLVLLQMRRHPSSVAVPKSSAPSPRRNVVHLALTCVESGKRVTHQGVFRDFAKMRGVLIAKKFCLQPDSN